MSSTRLGLNTSDMKMNRNTTGIARPMSMIRIISPSTQPPKKPLIAP